MSEPPKLLSRIADAARFVITGRSPAWFGPAVPIAAQAPPETAGRRLDYPVSANLHQRPRADEAITAAQLRALAENCDIVALAIQTRKDQLTGCAWQFQLVDKTARGKTEDPRLAMLAAFWRSPDQEHSWEEWISAIVDDLLVLDAATVYPRQNNGGGVYGFDFIDGGTIKRVIDPWGRTPLPPDPAYQQVLKGLSAVNYTSEELLYAPRNLRTHKLYGYSPVQQVAMTINVALRRQMAQLEYYTSGTVPDALAGVPEGWSADQIEDFQRYWDGLMTDDGAARRRLRFVPSAVAKGFVQTKEAALKDMFDEWLARVVSYAFSLSPQWAVKEMNRSTAETGQAMANAEGLAPLRKWIATLVNRCVKLGWGWDDIEFSWLEEEETNPQAQAEVSAIYLKLGVINLNEVRADLGRDPIEGGDVHLIYTASGAVPLSVAIAPPPPPPAQIGHNGGPPIDDTTEAGGEEALLKAAPAADRLAQIWAQFLTHAAPHVARAVAAAIPEPTTLMKAVGDDLPPDGTLAKPVAVAGDTLVEDMLLEIGAAMVGHVPPKAKAAIDEAVKAMPWPAVEAATAQVLHEEMVTGIQAGAKAASAVVQPPALPTPPVATAQAGAAPGASLGGGGPVAGITVRDATRMANPHAIQQAADQAAQLVKGVSDTTRAALNRIVVDAIKTGSGSADIAAQIVADHAFSPERALLIARTELNRAAVAGNIEAWRATSKLGGIKITKRVVLGANENHCIACRSAAMEGAIALEDSWTVGFAPPFHPACYCSLTPSVETALLKAFNPGQPRGPGGRWGSGGGGYDAVLEIARGKAAMASVLANHHDQMSAMNAPGLGPVSFMWGKTGAGAADRGGSGIAHLLVRRAGDGADGHALAMRVPTIIAHGAGRADGPRSHIFEHGGERVVLTQGGQGPQGHWVLTGYRITEKSR